MSFIPNTDTDRQEMFKTIGVNSFDELIKNIPDEILFKGELDLPDRVSEYEIVKLLSYYSNKNITNDTHISFMGGGAYDRFIPSIIGMILDRPEFKTAYTPYQAEVSQGTLQAMYEFQTMICDLTGMDISNASLYDGGSALAEACLMVNSYNKKSEILVAGTINPFYRQVIETICRGKNINFRYFIDEDGTCDIENLRNNINGNTSAVIVQQPNAYGILDDVFAIGKIAHNNQALFIVSIDPISLGILEAPGHYGADVVVGEGQPLGIPMSYGGPYLGIFACSKEFVRKLPGRIAGLTQDANGNKGFVLTLQTREQQIKRERATSNICTNQGLFMLAAAIYMATMGKNGIREVAEQSLYKAHYLAQQIIKIPGFKIINDKPFFCDFLVQTPIEPSIIINEGIKEGFLAGIDTGRFPECKQGLLISVTEKRSREEMDSFVDFLKKFSI